MNKKSELFLFLVIVFVSLVFFNNSYGQYTVGFSQCTIGHDWRKSQIRDMKIESAFYPDIKLIIKDAQNDNNIQIKHIEEFINEGINLLIVSANETDALTSVIEKAYSKGIPVILLERIINSNSYTAFIGCDNYSIGVEAARRSMKLLNGAGSIVEITGRNKTWSANERKRGFNDEISKYPKIKIIKCIDGEWSYSKSNKRISEELKKGLTFDLVFAHNDMMALGALKAIRDLGGRERPYIIGVDGLSGKFGGMQAVLNKDIDATFLYPTGGALAIKIANNILKGKPFKRQNILEALVIDSTNVKILKLLNNQIDLFQHKLETQSSDLKFQISKQRSQEVVLILVVISLLLTIILIILIYRNFQNKVKVNIDLKAINKEIKNQNNRISSENHKLIRFQNKLEDTLNDKLSFFTIVSHEFKTPLTLVKGPLEDLIRKKNYTFNEQYFFKLIFKNTVRLLQLVNQLMDLRKIERKKLELYPTKINVVDFIKNVVDSFIPLALQKNVEILTEYSNEDIEVLVDVEKIQKTIYSILNHFLNRSQAGGWVKIKINEVSISSEKSNIDEIFIEIKDNSTGVKQEQLESIFNSLDSSLTENDLGLNLAKEFIEMHGGRLIANSDNEKGVSFGIFLPNINESGFIGLDVIETQKQNEALIDFQNDFHIINSEENPVLVKPSLISSELPIILIVEDIDDVREFIKLSLNDKYNILEASNGVEALTIIKDQEPDLIISDVMMPEMDGFELTRYLKMDLKTSHIPIILLTAWGALENKLDGLEGGADAYILKPFSSKHLQVRISNLLEIRMKLINYYRNTSLLELDLDENGLNQMDKKFLSQLKIIIESSIEDNHLSIEELGKKMGMSRTYLYRKIKILTNMSVSEFIISVKLKKSLELLRNSGKTVAEIAFEVGFTSASYYTRCFKDVFRMTPSEYIKKNK